MNDAYPDFEVCWYGHIGDGNLHLNILKPAALSIDDFFAKCHHISPRLFEVVAQHDGSISAEHGVGLLKRDFLQYSRSADEISAHARTQSDIRSERRDESRQTAGVITPFDSRARRTRTI